uniref:Uncharacterized protein n=1 Tax=Arundo donax TaxID=35708 RepID=A0A0A8YF95_ARUDO
MRPPCHHWGLKRSWSTVNLCLRSTVRRMLVE